MARQPTPPGDAGHEEPGHEANLNQTRHEPVPASRQDERPQEAAQRSEDIQHHAGQPRRGPAPDDDRRPALDRLADAEPLGQSVPAPGAAAEELMGGPAPQGPVPDAPGVQAAAADSKDGRVTRIRAVSNAVPGKPDGEVDTRS